MPKQKTHSHTHTLIPSGGRSELARCETELKQQNVFAATGNEIRNSNIKCRRKVYYTFYHSFARMCACAYVRTTRMCCEET